MAYMKIRKWMTAAMTVCLLSAWAPTALAAGPGDALEVTTDASAASSSTSTSSTSDYWSGYKNADGTDFTYLEKGTEVSKFQNQNGAIDWKAAKADGLDFVMVRIAYGLTEDAYFDENVQGAQAAGIKVGAYLCSTAKNMDQVIAEANLTVEKIKKYQLAYPVAFDIEVNSILSEGATPAQLTAMSNKYCEIVKNAGYTPIVYANKTWLTKYMNVADIPYDVWFASYAEDKVYRPVAGTNTTIWQSSEKGTINGIIGKITTEFSKVAYGGSTSTTSSKSSTTNSATSAASTTTSGSQTVIASSGPVARSNEAVISTGGPTAVNEGWNQKADGTWNYYENGTMVTGWKQVNNYWYYMREDGSMATNWCNVGGTWYWLGSDGAMRTGWKQINGVWYYMDASGAMLQNCTSNIDGTDYRFDANGAWISQ